MKFSVLVLGLAISSASFSATILNDVKLAGLPTASKSYSKTTSNVSEVASAKTELFNVCSSDLTNTVNYLTRSGNKVLATEGCKVNVNDTTEMNCDQGGCSGDGLVHLDTGFTVTFK